MKKSDLSYGECKCITPCTGLRLSKAEIKINLRFIRSYKPQPELSYKKTVYYTEMHTNFRRLFNYVI